MAQSDFIELHAGEGAWLKAVRIILLVLALLHLLMANISLFVGERLEWDAETERFTNSERANELLHYEYRAPWKLLGSE